MVYRPSVTPTGFSKFFHFNWLLLLTVIMLVGIGLLMLYAVADGDPEKWMNAQALRFGLGLAMIFVIAFVPPVVWQMASGVIYVGVILLLILTLYLGVEVNGARRWLDIPGTRLQASEIMKVGLILAIATYYHYLSPKLVSHPLYMVPPILMTAIPAALVLVQPDLGTALFLLILGAAMMFIGGVHWGYFIVGALIAAGVVYFALESRGTEYQLLRDYQYERIEVFLDPTLDPSDAGYQIIQSKIALGSGGLEGRGFMQGTQSKLDFLPENHTDFIFTSYAESFGYIGTLALLGLFGAVNLLIALSAMQNSDRYGALVTAGIGVMIFLFYAVNMAMVMGLAPVVGLSLPFISWGGSTMLILCFAIGLVQNAHIHRPRQLR